jgi:hypothetical protein
MRSDDLAALADILLGSVYDAAAGVVSGCWWKKQKASSSSEFAKRLALAGRRVKEDDAHGKG